MHITACRLILRKQTIRCFGLKLWNSLLVKIFAVLHQYTHLNVILHYKHLLIDSPYFLIYRL